MSLLSRHNSWCHSFSPVSAGTLSVCVDEKTADHPVHVAALQFLGTVFTEETKSRGAEVPTSTSKHAAALRDIMSAPPASQLCEMLLRVCGGGGVIIINYLAAIKNNIYIYVCAHDKSRKNIDASSFFLSADARTLRRRPFRTPQRSQLPEL